MWVSRGPDGMTDQTDLPVHGCRPIRYRSISIGFGLVTSAVSLVLGTAVALRLGSEARAEILIDWFWVSFTLIAYPVLQQYDPSKNRAGAAVIGASRNVRRRRGSRSKPRTMSLVNGLIRAGETSHCVDGRSSGSLAGVCGKRAPYAHQAVCAPSRRKQKPPPERAGVSVVGAGRIELPTSSASRKITPLRLPGTIRSANR